MTSDEFKARVAMTTVSSRIAWRYFGWKVAEKWRKSGGKVAEKWRKSGGKVQRAGIAP